MSNAKLACATTALVAIALGGCVSLPVVENIRHAPPATGVEVTSAQVVRSAIERASLRTGWKIVSDSEGQMVVERSEKRRKATLALSYDANHYGIRYRDSEGFSYRWSPVADYGGTIINGERGKIHRDYNEWVKAFDRAIQDELNPPLR